ncbi:MAG TPA: hypothetical protein VLM11_07380 [Streptosporangiaceae bacterium]|nr:hypothetical protein [Streptosporangiaceae bacterium]
MTTATPKPIQIIADLFASEGAADYLGEAVTDNRHSEQGANWLASWFGPAVTEPVRLHVDAFAADACRLRRWDDEAKIPAAPTPAFEHFAPMLAVLIGPADSSLDDAARRQ